MKIIFLEWNESTSPWFSVHAYQLSISWFHSVSFLCECSCNGLYLSGGMWSPLTNSSLLLCYETAFCLMHSHIYGLSLACSFHISRGACKEILSLSTLVQIRPDRKVRGSFSFLLSTSKYFSCWDYNHTFTDYSCSTLEWKWTSCFLLNDHQFFAPTFNLQLSNPLNSKHLMSGAAGRGRVDKVSVVSAEPCRSSAASRRSHSALTLLTNIPLAIILFGFKWKKERKRTNN